MKYKDYKRLSKISLKSRKKTTRSTVRGISFGLILLMPLLFIVIAFHIDLNKEVNKDASIRVFNISYVNELSADTTYIESMLTSKSEKVYSIEGVENIIKYNNYKFKNIKQKQSNDEYINVSPFNIVIGENSFSLDYHHTNNTVNENIYSSDSNIVNLQIIDTEVSENLFIKSDEEAINGNNPLVAGKTFSSNSIGEIMVSSNLLSQYNLEVSDVIDQKITITYELASYFDNVTTSKTEIDGSTLSPYQNIPVTILKDYTIIGVFDSNIYKTNVRKEMQDEESYGDQKPAYETYFWLTTDSLYNTMGHTYLAENIRIEEESGNGYTYYNSGYYYSNNPIELSKNARASNNVFIPLGMGASQKNVGNSQIPEFNTIIEFESYGHANDAVGLIDSLYKEGAVGAEEPSVTTGYMQNTFENYRMFYNVFTYASIVLAIFGGVVFFATLLNLYNTIHYSVQSRKNYLGMIRAIGMKGVDVIKMYFVEIFQIFKRSYIWTAIFGGGICFGISFLFDMIMKSGVGEIITIDLSLNPIYILVAFLILLLINTIISIVFSLVACHNVARKPVLEVLVENR